MGATISRTGARTRMKNATCICTPRPYPHPMGREEPAYGAVGASRAMRPS